MSLKPPVSLQASSTCAAPHRSTAAGLAWAGTSPCRPPPPPPKLKPSKRLPAPTPTTQAKAAPDANDSGDRPTLHRKTDDAPTSAPSATQPTSAPDDNKPTLHRRSADPDSSSSDPDKPTLHRKADPDAGASSGSASSGSGSSSDDPDRPTLHRRSDTPAAAPDVDPDRPTLRRTPAAEASGTDVGSAPGAVTATTAVDPDRPTLSRGVPAIQETALEPTRLASSGVPIRQMVAVSDGKTSEPEPYLYHWTSPQDEAAMRTAMEALATRALAAPTAASLAPVPTFGPATKTRAHTAAKPAPAALPLADEVFQSYELAFSSGPTVVLSARGGPSGDRYITLIAQPDFYGQPRVLFKQVSTAATLDQTPRMKLIDAVDTDGDRRAELIFELIGSSATTPTSPPERQYAIYRVTAAGAEQVFSTGPLP